MKVHKAKNGAFYKILADGRARFISAAAARKAKGGAKAKPSRKKSAKTSAKKSTSRKRSRR